MTPLIAGFPDPKRREAVGDVGLSPSSANEKLAERCIRSSPSASRSAMRSSSWCAGEATVGETAEHLTRVRKKDPGFRSKKPLKLELISRLVARRSRAPPAARPAACLDSAIVDFSSSLAMLFAASTLDCLWRMPSRWSSLALTLASLRLAFSLRATKSRRVSWAAWLGSRSATASASAS